MNKGDELRIEMARSRYLVATHAMQTGVNFTMQSDPEEAKQVTPKHLRVGVNVALVNHTALVTLLINKGIITEVEYYESIASKMEQEVARYKRRLEEMTGKKVDLI